MTLDVHYLGRLPFYGDRVRNVLERIGGADTVVHPLVLDRDALNATLRALRTPPPGALIVCPLAPESMLADVSPIAVSLGYDAVGLLTEFRSKLGSDSVPVLCPLVGKAFSDPAQDVQRLREAGIRNAMVALAPNLVGAGDVIRDAAYRLSAGDAERALAALVGGGCEGLPAISMAEWLRTTGSAVTPGRG
jgi:hypothetical protein